MEFRCPYCLHTRFQMVPGRVDEAICMWCGKESKITNQARRADKPLVRSGLASRKTNHRAKVKSD